MLSSSGNGYAEAAGRKNPNTRFVAPNMDGTAMLEAERAGQKAERAGQNNKKNVLLHQIWIGLQCSKVQKHMEDGAQISRKRNTGLACSPRSEGKFSFASNKTEMPFLLSVEVTCHPRTLGFRGSVYSRIATRSDFRRVGWECPKWTVLIGRTVSDTTMSIPDPTLS